MGKFHKNLESTSGNMSQKLLGNFKIFLTIFIFYYSWYTVRMFAIVYYSFFPDKKVYLTI